LKKGILATGYLLPFGIIRFIYLGSLQPSQDWIAMIVYLPTLKTFYWLDNRDIEKLILWPLLLLNLRDQSHIISALSHKVAVYKRQLFT
jgi:hypothetical protein